MTTSVRPVSPVAFSPAPASYSQQWQSAFNAQLQRKISLLAGPYTIQPQLYLQSPDGTVWKVAVDNLGQLSTTLATRDQIKPPL